MNLNPLEIIGVSFLFVCGSVVLAAVVSIMLGWFRGPKP